uniref:Uncharacterized protein n=1 Tax=Arundo donax TaxID=35708 RepID=A0A0A9HQ54_ARUDO
MIQLLLLSNWSIRPLASAKFWIDLQILLSCFHGFTSRTTVDILFESSF